MKIPCLRQTLAAFVVLALAVGHACATSPEQEDWAAARKANCKELVDAYKTTSAAERQVVAAIKESRDGTIATNVMGVATLAVFGIGFFTWNDDATAEENLADLRNDINIITTVAAEKQCKLPPAASAGK
jgi:hypothetical protein